jgi:hypothetical protein
MRGKTKQNFLPVDVLRLFNEKAEELNASRFLASIREGKTTYSFTIYSGAAPKVESNFPHIEEVKAFVLTFRLFIQANEFFSFRKLGELYLTLPLPDHIKSAAAELFADLNSYLNSSSKLVVDGVQVTRRDVLGLVLYGGLAHANNVTRKTAYDYWASNPVLKVVLDDEFVEILGVMTQHIFWMRHVNLDALKELSA